MRPSLLSCAAIALFALAPPAQAVTGGSVVRNPYGVRQSVVRVESSRGELCSGTLIAPDLVLTAAHCVLQRASYRVIGVDSAFRQRAVMATAAALHPAFVPGTTPRTQPGVDLALLKLRQPLGPDFAPLDPRAASPVGAGQPVELAGFGATAESAHNSARVLRRTELVTLGTLQVANRVLVVADQQRLAATSGAGACRGDSGGPILQGGRLVGVVSWSSGALRSRVRTACGGFTAVTPIAEHSSWIAQRAYDLERYAPVQAVTQPRAPSSAAGWWGR
jgi:secreted trypsin-like serine protease